MRASASESAVWARSSRRPRTEALTEAVARDGAWVIGGLRRVYRLPRASVACRRRYSLVFSRLPQTAMLHQRPVCGLEWSKKTQ